MCMIDIGENKLRNSKVATDIGSVGSHTNARTNSSLKIFFSHPGSGTDFKSILGNSLKQGYRLIPYLSLRIFVTLNPFRRDQHVDANVISIAQPLYKYCSQTYKNICSARFQ